jgi:hypothetical protein
MTIVSQPADASKRLHAASTSASKKLLFALGNDGDLRAVVWIGPILGEGNNQ